MLSPRNSLFLPFSFLFFSCLLFACVVSTIFWTFLYNSSPPSERANISYVSIDYTVSTSEAALRGSGAASPFASLSCSSWTRVYVIRTLQLYHTWIFTLYKVLRRPLFGHRYTFLSALFWLPSIRLCERKYPATCRTSLISFLFVPWDARQANGAASIERRIIHNMKFQSREILSLASQDTRVARSRIATLKINAWSLSPPYQNLVRDNSSSRKFSPFPW